MSRFLKASDVQKYFESYDFEDAGRASDDENADCLEIESEGDEEEFEL